MTGIRRAWALDAPTMTADESFVLTGGGDAPVVMPLPAFLVEHDLGLMLFDSRPRARGGGRPRCGLRPAGRGVPGGVPRGVPAGPADRGTGLPHRRRPARGAFPRPLRPHRRTVALPARTRLRRLPHELRYAQQPAAHLAGFFRDQDLEAAAKISWNELPAGYDHDLFGDGSVTLLSLPGHTPGRSGCSCARTAGPSCSAATPRTCGATSARPPESRWTWIRCGRSIRCAS